MQCLQGVPRSGTARVLVRGSEAGSRCRPSYTMITTAWHATARWSIASLPHPYQKQRGGEPYQLQQMFTLHGTRQNDRAMAGKKYQCLLQFWLMGFQVRSLAFNIFTCAYIDSRQKQFTSENVVNFKYVVLGTTATHESDTQAKITIRRNAGNICYYSHQTVSSLCAPSK